MSPCIILRDGKPFWPWGTRGSASDTTILRVFLNIAVYGKTLDEKAVAAPRYHHQGLPEDLFYERGSLQSTINA